MKYGKGIPNWVLKIILVILNVFGLLIVLGSLPQSP